MATIGICAWLILQTPTGYAELRDKTYSDADRAAIEQRLEGVVADIELEFRKQMRNGDASAENLDSSFVLSQDDLNALLSGDKYSNRDFNNVRTMIFDDFIRFATEVNLSDEKSIVVSVDFRLQKTADEHLKLEILGGSIGRLPMPIVWILSRLPENSFPRDDKIEFNFADAKPHVLVSLDQSSSDPNLKSIQFSNQQVKLRFGLPIVAH